MPHPAAKPLQTEQEYHEALAHLERIFSTARRGTSLGDEFERLSTLIADWEHQNLVIERSNDPIGQLKFAMGNRGTNEP